MQALGTFIALVGFAAMGVALWGLVRGRVTWAAIASRRMAGAVLAGSFVVIGVGGAMSPEQDDLKVPTEGTTATTTAKVAEPTRTTTAKPTTTTTRPSTANTTRPKPTTTTEPVATTTTTRAAAGPTFANCSQAKAAGYHDIQLGQPGYSIHLDRDRDGVACES
jgi:hypothetical protein